LTGAYPNPTLAPAAVATALAQVDCDGAAIGVGAALATCTNLADAIAAIPAPAPAPDDVTTATAAANAAVRGLSAGNVNKPTTSPATVADINNANSANLDVSYASMLRLFTNSAAAANVDAAALGHNAGVMNSDGTLGHYARWNDYAAAGTIGASEDNGGAHRLQQTIPSGTTMVLAPAKYAGEIRYIYTFPNALSPLEFLNIQAQGPSATAGFVYGPLRSSFSGDLAQKTLSTFTMRRGEGIILVARAGNQWNVVGTAYSTLRGANYAEVSPGVINAWGASPISLGTLPPLASSTVVQGSNGNELLIGQLA
jgi:hypothetical protein